MSESQAAQAEVLSQLHLLGDCICMRAIEALLDIAGRKVNPEHLLGCLHVIARCHGL